MGCMAQKQHHLRERDPSRLRACLSLGRGSRTFDLAVLLLHPGAHGPREALHNRVHQVKLGHVVHVRAVRLGGDLLQLLLVRVFHPCVGDDREGRRVKPRGRRGREPPSDGTLRCDPPVHTPTNAPFLARGTSPGRLFLRSPFQMIK